MRGGARTGGGRLSARLVPDGARLAAPLAGCTIYGWCETHSAVARDE